MALYRLLIVEELLLPVLAVTLWIAGGRALAALGPGTAGTGLWAWIGWGCAIVVAAFMAAQALLMGRDARGQDLATARKQLEDMEELLPHTAAEARAFGVLALATGVGEEVVYRGFVLAWVAAWLSGPLGLGATVSLWSAVVLSSILFGLAHAYQGRSGILQNSLSGFGFALLAVATGGLLAPMIAHAALDLSTGVVARKAYGGRHRGRSAARPA